MNSVFGCALLVLSSLAVIVAASPAFALLLPPLAAAYAALGGRYRNVARELKRAEAVAEAPMLSSLAETVAGLTTIRAYGAVRPTASALSF